MNTVLQVLLGSLILLCNGIAFAQDNRLDLRMGDGVWPAWQGVSVGETTLNMGNVMYPGGGGVEGFLAAVITHGLLLQGSRTAMRNEQQAKANQVLTPHRATIEQLTPDSLLSSARERLSPEEIHNSSALEMRPTYAMSGDERFLILDNLVLLHSPVGTPSERMIRVISPFLEASDPTAHWQLDRGQPLRVLASDMLAHTVRLSLSVPPDAASQTGFKTLRYRSGNIEALERGKLLAQGCDRIILETLRGWILSAPRVDPVTGGCASNPNDLSSEGVTARAAAPSLHPGAAATDPTSSPPAPSVPATPPH